MSTALRNHVTIPTPQPYIPLPQVLRPLQLARPRPTVPNIVHQMGQSKTPVGAIVGGVAGGLALVVPLLFWWKRRQGSAAQSVPPELKLPVIGSASRENLPFIPEYQGEPRSLAYYTGDAESLPQTTRYIPPTRTTSVGS